MKKIASHSYALIIGADQPIAKTYALDLAKQNHNLLLIGKPQQGLMDWAHQLMTYGIEAEFFETDLSNQQSLELLADWIQASYSISHCYNLAEVHWMWEVFCTELSGVL